MSKVSLKQRISNKDQLNIAFIEPDIAEDALKERLASGPFDLAFVDGQHYPFCEERLREICLRLKEHSLPVLFRIQHTELAFMTGNYLDIGPLAIVIPQVEDPATVRTAVESFYYPPVGKRGWGPFFAYNKTEIKGTRGYADWWNENGILAVQLESVNAVKNVKSFAIEGVDLILYGPGDLTFDIEAQKDPEFPDLETCYRHVENELKDVPVKLSRGGMPFGTL